MTKKLKKIIESLALLRAKDEFCILVSECLATKKVTREEILQNEYCNNFLKEIFPTKMEEYDGCTK